MVPAVQSGLERRSGQPARSERADNLAKLAALPWYSLLLVRPEDDDVVPTWRLVTGPARYRKTGWYLPVHGALDGQTPAAMYAGVMRAREDQGYQALVRSARR